jgi:hypothetical protein
MVKEDFQKRKTFNYTEQVPPYKAKQEVQYIEFD